MAAAIATVRDSLQFGAIAAGGGTSANGGGVPLGGGGGGGGGVAAASPTSPGEAGALASEGCTARGLECPVLLSTQEVWYTQNMTKCSNNCALISVWCEVGAPTSHRTMGCWRADISPKRPPARTLSCSVLVKCLNPGIWRANCLRELHINTSPSRLFDGGRCSRLRRELLLFDGGRCSRLRRELRSLGSLLRSPL